MVKHYKHLSITDGLTKIYNHRYFHEFLDRELQRAEGIPARLHYCLQMWIILNNTMM